VAERPPLKPRRKPAAEKPASSISSRVPAPIQEPARFNNNYKKSYAQIEGASFIYNTKERFNNDEEFALAMITSLRGLYWWDRHGVEGSLKTKVMGYNDVGNEVNPTSIEARYHYRFIWPFLWFSFLPEVQLSLFSGFELFTNNVSGGLQFVDGYHLLKTGAALKFPAWERWETGGEVAVGWWMDDTKKYEMQGYINYFIKPKWTLGIGYRLNLLDLGSAEKSPTGELPHREGYGEAYGSLRFLW
jgi:hypothetical protein